MIEVFNRYENKFMMDDTTYQSIKKHLDCKMSLDEYCKNGKSYPIANIYFDTQDDQLIKCSLSKPAYKEKLRLRYYGVPNSNDKVFLEIKKKVLGLVNKRRSPLGLDEAYSFVSNGEQPKQREYMNAQVLNEIEYFLKVYQLEPKVYIAYDRQAYFSNGNHDLRITFDNNIRSRRTDLRLESGDYGDLLLDGDLWLMEIKSDKSIPVWLSTLLSDHKLYKSSFSKYGTEYKMQLAKNNMTGGNEQCLNLSLTPQLRPHYQLVPQY